MYYFKLILILCANVTLAFSSASIMYHMQNIIGVLAGLYLAGVGVYLFIWNEREHQHER